MNTGEFERAVVVGPGALGISFAVLLSRGIPVSLIGKATHEKEISQAKFSLTGSLNIDSREPFQTFEKWESCPIFVAVKAYQLEEALKQILPSINSTTPVVLLQNGIGIIDDAKRVIPDNIPLLRGLSHLGGAKDSPTSVITSGEPSITLASENVTIRNKITSLLTRTGFHVQEIDSVRDAEWNKALINIIVNPICAMFGLKNRGVVETPDLRELASLLLAEIRSVAKAAGISLIQRTDNEIFQDILKYGDNTNSLLQDIRKGYKNEIDFYLGRFLKEAKKVGVEVPQAEKLYAEFFFMNYTPPSI